MLDFPSSPAANQIYASGNLAWRWDGVKWVAGTSVPPVIIAINTTTALPAGFNGFVRVENNTSAPITVTMPPSPVQGQRLTIKDNVGNAGLYTIVINGGGVNIEGLAGTALVANYSWVDLIYTGSQWVQA